MEEPNWKNKRSAKKWLEQKYTGSAEEGSPLYQYLLTLNGKTHGLEGRLTLFELARWLRANNITHSLHYPPPSDSKIFYPSYEHPEVLRQLEEEKRQDHARRRSSRIAKSKQAKPRPTKDSEIVLEFKDFKKRRMPKQSLMRTKPDVTRQLGPRIRALRPGAAGRKHSVTGEEQPEYPNPLYLTAYAI